MAIKVAAETQSTKGAGESVVDKLKALDAQRAELLEGAKQEAVATAEKAVADLNSLGFDYRLVEGTSTTREPRKAILRQSQDTPKRQLQDKPCKICEFKTTPLHDARAHRSQNPKKPFTVEELMEKGLSKVG